MSPFVAREVIFFALQVTVAAFIYLPIFTLVKWLADHDVDKRDGARLLFVSLNVVLIYLTVYGLLRCHFPPGLPFPWHLWL